MLSTSLFARATRAFPILILALAAFLVLTSSSLAAGGSASFELSPQTSQLDDLESILTGDVDGDGDLDLLTSTWEPGKQTLWINDGTGLFSASPKSLPIAPDTVDALDLGDMDGDGDLDILVLTRVGLVLWLNDGAGGFEPDGAPMGLWGGDDLALGDLDGDGDLDALKLTSSEGDVWLNDGTGVLSLLRSDEGITAEHGVLADLNGDGSLDLFAVDYDGYGLWLNDGQGAFALVWSGPTMDHAMAVAASDLDGDGDIDTVVVGSGQNEIWLNDGAGQMTRSAQDLGGASNTFGVDFADVDGDGDLDLALGRRYNDSLWINDGSGQFTEALGYEELEDSFVPLFGDWDMDGAPDLARMLASNVRLERNEQPADFRHYQSFNLPAASAVALGDLDGDGNLDAFVGDAFGAHDAVLLGSGDGAFVDSDQRLGSSTTTAVALGDLDGDGDLDAVSAGTRRATIWANDGAATMTQLGAALGTDSEYARDCALGDVDGDGDLDLVLGDDSGYRVWFNKGTGLFEAEATQSYPCLSSLTLGDLDGDGDLDMMVLSEYQSLYPLFNDGAGVFAAGPDLITESFYLRAAYLGDFDGDGDLDVYAAWADCYTAPQVWLNDGTGQFALGQEIPDVIQLLAYGVGDLDGDNTPDLFLPGWEHGYVLLNVDGELLGSICEVDWVMWEEEMEVALGDVDNDGDLDAFVSVEDMGRSFVYLNQDHANLRVTKTSSADEVASGEQFTYTLVYSNAGPQALAGEAKLFDLLPDEAMAIEPDNVWEADADLLGWRTILATPQGAEVGHGVLVGDLAAEQVHAALSLDVDLGEQVAQVSIHRDGWYDFAELYACGFSLVDKAHPLVATAFARESTLSGMADEPESYHVQFLDADGLVLCKGALTRTRHAPLMATINGLDVGQGGKATVRARMMFGPDGETLNTAFVVSQAPDLEPSDNIAVSSVDAVAVDVPLVVGVGPSAFCPGWNLYYTWSITNTSPIALENLLVRQIVPWTQVSMASSASDSDVEGEFDASGDRLVWRVDSLPVGESIVLKSNLHSFSHVSEPITSTFIHEGDAYLWPVTRTVSADVDTSLCAEPSPVPTATLTPDPVPTIPPLLELFLPLIEMP